MALPNPARRALTAIAAFACLSTVGLAAVPASAASAGRLSPANAQATGPAGSHVRAACCATAGAERPPSARLPLLPALARLQWLRALEATQTVPAAAARAAANIRAAALGAERQRPGALTGVVRGADGVPVAGACVTATGPSGSLVRRSGSDGRYMLAGLPVGQYTLRVSDCAGPARTEGSPAKLALWPGLPTKVMLGSGQVRTLPAVMLRPAGAAAASLQRQAAAPGRATTGGISGRVTGKGNSLQGVCVVADRVGGGFGRSAETSSTGRYRITGLQPGRYNVQFGEAFCGKGNWLSQWYPGITTPFPTSKAAAIRVTAGKTKTGIDANMKLGGQIGGTVRAKSGTLLPGICLTIQGRVHGGFVGYGFESGRGGRYALHALFPGKYTVQFSIGCRNKGNYAAQWWRLKSSAAQATPITITRALVVSHIDAALAPGALISGTVRALNATGKPLAGICVTATDDRGDEFALATTAKDGSYQLKGLAGRRYVIVFDPTCFGQSSSIYLGQQRRVSVSQGGSLSGVNAYLQPGAGISGVVKDSHGNPLAGICVQIAGKQGNALSASGANGSYTITGLPAGSYLVQFAGGCGNPGSVTQQFYNSEPNVGSADPVTLTAGAITTGIDATMQPGATITGTVTDTAGHRLTGICVGIADQTAASAGLGIFDVIEFTSGGNYRAANLTPGRYQVSFGCGIGKYITDLYRPSGSAGFPQLLSVPVGVTSKIDAVLTPGGAIAGTVTNKAGKPLPFACVSVVEARTGLPVPGYINQRFAINGKYKITGLPAGEYKVQFAGCGGRYGSQWFRHRATEGSADPVRVRAARTTTGIGGALSIGGSISGLVTAKATGKPVAKVCVVAVDTASQVFGLAETGKTGRYTLKGLSTGRYTVAFSPCSANGQNLVAAARPGTVLVTAPHAVTGINASLATGGAISGTVKAGSHSQLGTCVEVQPVNPAGSFGFAITASDGSYTATGLGAGKYQVLFNDPTCQFGVPQFAAQWYNGQSTQATAAIVTVSVGGTTSGIDASLQPFGGISGTVTGPGATPVARECVTATPVGKDFAGTVPPEFAVTTKAGGYSLVGVQPGTYKVKFSVGCGDSGFATQWWQDASSASAAMVITVGGGAAVTGIDAALTH
jgi:hypothetical protein